MNIKDNITSAFSSIWSHKLHSFLTSLGVFIGVTSIIGILSIISGLNAAFKEQLSSIGSNTLYIQKYPWINSLDWEKYRNRKDITYRTFYKLAKSDFKYVTFIAPNISTYRMVKYKSKRLQNINIIGTTPEDLYIENYKIKYGRFLNGIDDKKTLKSAIIGYDIYAKLFDTTKTSIGNKIKIGNMVYNIVGVLQKRGAIFGQSQDNIVIIPFKTFLKNFGKNRNITIIAAVENPDNIKNAIEELRIKMRKIRKVPNNKEDDFSINQQQMILDLYNKLTGSLYLFMILISSIASIVGGIGIMNIMLVTVTERTKEIGIRRAIGAKKQNIIFQFLFESGSISLIGGIFGILAGFGIAKLIETTTIIPKISLPIWLVTIGVLFSFSVGIFFGIYPAYKAANLNPVEALHYE